MLNSGGQKNFKTNLLGNKDDLNDFGSFVEG